MKDRGSVMLIENNKVALIKRIKADSVYYVFPGGGIEEGETPEAAAKREALEEVGVEVEILECLAKVNFNGTHYFFLAEILDGVFGTGQGDEYTHQSGKKGTYLPMWIAISELDSLDIKPREVAKII